MGSDYQTPVSGAQSVAERADPQGLIDMWILCMVMRVTGANIKAQYGDESDQYYAFLEAADKNERLLDAIPGARKFVLEALL